jgi:hypothetical protein
MMKWVSSSSRANVAFLLPFILNKKLVTADNKPASFLSATFSTKISPVSDSLFDDTKKEVFCQSSEEFFQKVFDGHEANINIVSVGVFDEHIAKLTGAEVSVEKLRFQQYPRDHTLSFSTIVVAQYQDGTQVKLMSPELFHQNVLYSSQKLQNDLVTFLRQSDDLYFSDVESVHFDAYQASNLSESESNNDDTLGMSKETVDRVSIIVIVICSVLSAVFLFASFKLHQKRKELIRHRLKVEDLNLAAVAYNKALDVYPTDPSSINDDFSFDPLVTYNTDVLADTTTLISNQSKATQSPLFEPQTSKNSYTDELQRLPRDHIFAPPGKLGVAIDIFNGQPVVQKIRKGSPITGMLQEGDIILAIDDVDISCMSLAEVTFLMVKNMERVRRITFVRRNK